MAMQISRDTLAALAVIAAGRDHITTAEFARALNKAAQTVRKLHCLTGQAYGVRPIKPPGSNGLLWPVADTASVLAGEACK